MKTSPTNRLLGNDGKIWEDENLKEDLVALKPVYEFDPLTLWLVKTFLGLFHRVFGHRYKPGQAPIPMQCITAKNI